MVSKDDDSCVDNGNTELFLRYASQEVLYLLEEQDKKQLRDQICHEDGYQRSSRREWSGQFYALFQVRGEEIHGKDVMGDRGKEELIIGKTGHSKVGFCAQHFNGEKRQVHNCTVMKNVGHDHTLIFQSAEGQEGVFSGPSL